MSFPLTRPVRMVTIAAMSKAFLLPVLTCLRCGTEWTPRKAEHPRRCPKCRSPYWDKPKKAA